MLLQIASLLILGCSYAVATNDTFTRTSPPLGAIIVDASGRQPNSYLNVSAAVTNLNDSKAPQEIFIFPGTYTEQVYIGPLAGPLIIQGFTQDARSYQHNQVTITGNLSRQDPNFTDDETATLRLLTPNIKVYNLNIANTFGQAEEYGQALALSAQNTDQGFYGCNFTGYQDTMNANEGRQIYAKSYISGAVDFVFGLRGIAWFHDVDIETIGPGSITANGRDSENNTSIYVFNQATVRGNSGAHTTYLGRPWRQYSRVVFQDSYLGDVIKPEGWSRWDNVQSVENVYYREYNNSGPGANTSMRVNFSAQLTHPVEAADLFGETFLEEAWVDENYLE